MRIELHSHGIDCCWDCFEGKKTHPKYEDDGSCVWEVQEFGKDSDCAKAGHPVERSSRES
jgi:hypothetical protein